MRTLLFSAVLLSGIACAQSPVDVQKVLQRDFQARGQATMERVVQDGLQRVCTDTHDRPPSELARQLEADQMKTIDFPQGSLIGDWKRGERIAQGGRGLTWNDKPGAGDSNRGGASYPTGLPPPPPQVYYRVTTRVDGPRNTRSYTQVLMQ